MGFSPSEALQGALSLKFCGGEGKDGGSHFNFCLGFRVLSRELRDGLKGTSLRGLGPKRLLWGSRIPYSAPGSQ